VPGAMLSRDALMSVLIWCCLQDGIRVEKERQRASGRVQQLQAELSAMRSHQDSLRQRLQERLTAQERDAAAKSRELASLRRAGELCRCMPCLPDSVCEGPHATTVRAFPQYVHRLIPSPQLTAGCVACMAAWQEPA
jgi:hypothetical protein